MDIVQKMVEFKIEIKHKRGVANETHGNKGEYRNILEKFTLYRIGHGTVHSFCLVKLLDRTKTDQICEKFWAENFKKRLIDTREKNKQNVPKCF